MSFPQYSEHKDSGVDWLGEVPAHWDVLPGRRIYSQKRDPSVEGDEQLSATQKYGVVPQRLFMEMEDQKVTLALSGLGGFKHVEKNDFVISLRSFQGGIEWSQYSGCVSPAYTILRPTLPVEPQYMAYVLKSGGYISALQSVTDGIRDGKNISYEQFGQIGLPLPSAKEQAKISEFLRQETSKIDGLVMEQEKLIALLKEKRQAVISHAVTKGLDPSVPMKDSGIEWLGEVPAHWQVLRLKYISPHITVGIVVEPSKYYCEEGIPALRSLNVKPGKINLENMVFISGEANELHSKSKLQKGDLVAVRSGQPGVTAVVPAELDGCNCIDLIIIRRPEDGDENFLCWCLASDVAIRQFSEGSGGAIQQHFNIGTAVDLIVAVPPASVQRDIAYWLSEKTCEIDKLIVEAERGIGLLGERRSALISAAVTGKIDVRQLASAEAA